MNTTTELQKQVSAQYANLSRVKVFQSLDPLWKYWGCTRDGHKNTKWFVRKQEAEHYAKTGDDSKAVVK